MWRNTYMSQQFKKNKFKLNVDIILIAQSQFAAFAVLI